LIKTVAACFSLLPFETGEKKNSKFGKKKKERKEKKEKNDLSNLKMPSFHLLLQYIYS